MNNDPTPTQAREIHRWTPAQLAFLDEAIEVMDAWTIRHLYAFYAAKFGRWSATYNQFRTRFYCKRNPEVGRKRARRNAAGARYRAKLLSLQIAG